MKRTTVEITFFYVFGACRVERKTYRWRWLARLDAWVINHCPTLSMYVVAEARALP